MHRQSKAELRVRHMHGSMPRASIIGIFCFSGVGVCGPHRVQRDSEVRDRAPPFFPNAGRGQIKDFIQLIQQSASGGTKQGPTVFLWDCLDEEGRGNANVQFRHDDDDDVFYLSCRNKNQPKAKYPKGTSHHTRLLRGPSTNDMKK